MGRKQLFPQDLTSVTTTQRNALTPVDGEILYNSTLSMMQVRHGGAWVSLGVVSREVQFQVGVTPLESVRVDNQQAAFWVPPAMNNWVLSDIEAAVISPPRGGLVTAQLFNFTQGWNMLSTAATIDADELNTTTAATPPAIDTGSNHNKVLTGDLLVVNISTANGAQGFVMDAAFTPE
jgi:hypothetical protein